MATERPTEQSLTLQSPVGTREPLALGKSLTVPMQSETNASCLCVCVHAHVQFPGVFFSIVYLSLRRTPTYSVSVQLNWVVSSPGTPPFPHLYVLALTAMPDLHGC